ncbi:MAG: DsbA family protein, partial [Nitrosotalea sp.]
QISLPKFSFPHHKINYTPLLIVLLIIESLFLGSFYTQVQDLKSGGGATAMAAGTTQTAAGAVQPTTVAAPVVAHVDNGHFPARGDANAKVTIVEFADFRCPYCKQVEDNVMPQLQKDYIDTGKVKLYFRQYDFLGPASTVAANAAECANDQGEFWQYHDYLYKNQPDETDTSMYTVDNLTTIAGQLGLDTNQFNSCLSANTDNQKVTDDMTAGQKAGVSGTPTFYINGTQLVGAEPYSVFQTTIDAALKKS